MRYIKGSLNCEQFYANSNESILGGFANSDWAGDTIDRKSTTGFLFKVFGSTVCRSTRKQTTVAISSTEPEYVALAEAAREGVWLANLLEDFGYANSPLIIYEDNQSWINLTKKPEHKRLKHMNVKFNFVQDLVSNQRLFLKYICTRDQVADILTKNLIGNNFIRFKQSLGLVIS